MATSITVTDDNQITVESKLVSVVQGQVPLMLTTTPPQGKASKRPGALSSSTAPFAV